MNRDLHEKYGLKASDNVSPCDYRLRSEHIAQAKDEMLRFLISCRKHGNNLIAFVVSEKTTYVCYIGQRGETHADKIHFHNMRNIGNVYESTEGMFDGYLIATETVSGIWVVGGEETGKHIPLSPESLIIPKKEKKKIPSLKKAALEKALIRQKLIQICAEALLLLLELRIVFTVSTYSTDLLLVIFALNIAVPYAVKNSSFLGLLYANEMTRLTLEDKENGGTKQ